MTDEKQERQKTVVSFVVGLLIGGLLVWAFSGPSDEPKQDKNSETPTEEVADDAKDAETEKITTTQTEEAEKATLPVGDGKIVVAKQAASTIVKLDSATYPVPEGWVGVRDYTDGKLGGLLGVVRFSEEQGLIPSDIILQRATIAGNEYAVVVYSENGDRQFNLAEDAQVGEVYSTFTAE